MIKKAATQSIAVFVLSLVTTADLLAHLRKRPDPVKTISLRHLMSGLEALTHLVAENARYHGPVSDTITNLLKAKLDQYSYEVMDRITRTMEKQAYAQAELEAKKLHSKPGIEA